MAQTSRINDTLFPLQGKWRDIEDSFTVLLNSDQTKIGHPYDIQCQWQPFRDQILMQWPLLTEKEVYNAGPNRGYIAMLISAKYGLDYRIIKNYLTNLERNLPLM